MSENNYGTCNECGYTAPSWESARLHVRDKHGGIQRITPYFEGDQ